MLPSLPDITWPENSKGSDHTDARTTFDPGLQKSMESYHRWPLNLLWPAGLIKCTAWSTLGLFFSPLSPQYFNLERAWFQSTLQGLYYRCLYQVNTARACPRLCWQSREIVCISQFYIYKWNCSRARYKGFLTLLNLKHKNCSPAPRRTMHRLWSWVCRHSPAQNSLCS